MYFEVVVVFESQGINESQKSSSWRQQSGMQVYE
jgi:hypothetical protein